MTFENTRSPDGKLPSINLLRNAPVPQRSLSQKAMSLVEDWRMISREAERLIRMAQSLAGWWRVDSVVDLGRGFSSNGV